MHHAYLYEGPFSLLGALAESARTKFLFTEEHSPNVFIESWEKFGIDEARSLRERASLKNTEGRALFVLGVASLTTEAQQALLKLFEEPQAGVVFVLLVPHGTLIPTLKSRFVMYPEKVEVEEKVETEVKKFLAAPYKTRSADIAALLKEEGGEKERVRDFISSLEVVLYAKFQTIPAAQKRSLAENLHDISRVRSYVGDRSPALKMLLEHLAVSLPTF